MGLGYLGGVGGRGAAAAVAVAAVAVAAMTPRALPLLLFGISHPRFRGVDCFVLVRRLRIQI